MMDKYQRVLKHIIRPRNFQEILSVIIENFFSTERPLFDNQRHLEASIDWLLMASEITNHTGFSKAYSLECGWDKPYPETTGYIIPTLLNFINYSNYRKKEITEAIISSGEWLLSIQDKDGSFYGLDNKKPIVFDTGQILFGLCAMYKYTKLKKYLRALEKAANWLSKIQEKKGCWEKYTFNNLRHSYCSRVSWALLEAYQVTDNLLYKEKAQKQLEWVIHQQQENSWFKYSYFLETDISVLHTIAYTIRGLFESGLMLNNQRYINSAQKTTDILLSLNKENILYGFYDKNWLPVVTSRCLTGLSQIAIIWLRVYEKTKDYKYLEEVTKIINFLKLTQDILTKNKNLKGAIAGSYPIYGKYDPWIYPNWAVKFFIDLLLWDNQIKNNANNIIYKG